MYIYNTFEITFHSGGHSCNEITLNGATPFVSIFRANEHQRFALQIVSLTIITITSTVYKGNSQFVYLP